MSSSALCSRPATHCSQIPNAADFLLKASSVFKINLDGNGQEAYASSCNSGTSYNSISSVVSR